MSADFRLTLTDTANSVSVNLNEIPSWSRPETAINDQMVFSLVVLSTIGEDTTTFRRLSPEQDGIFYLQVNYEPVYGNFSRSSLTPITLGMTPDEGAIQLTGNWPLDIPTNGQASGRLTFTLVRDIPQSKFTDIGTAPPLEEEPALAGWRATIFVRAL